MKRSILIFLAIIKFSFAQTHYLDSTSHWHENSTFYSNWIPTALHYQDYVYYLSSDSIINSISYFKLFRVGIDSVVTISTQQVNLVSFNELIGLIREDTNSRKIYFISYASAYEDLLYDFSLTLGDTIPDSYGFTFCSPGNIYSEDSIYLGSQIRKRLFVNATNLRTGGVQIFEGIGANCGLLGTMCIYYDGIYPCLMSYYDSEDTVQFIDCSGFTTEIEPVDKPAQLISVSPNPCVDKLQYSILKNDFKRVSFSVLTLLGEIMIKVDENKVQDGYIDVSGLPWGMYLLYGDLDGERIIVKVIKGSE